MKTLNVDTTTNLDDSSSPSIPKKTQVIPPEVSSAKSILEEVQTSVITLDISKMDTNVKMCNGMSTHEAQGISNAYFIYSYLY